MYLLGPGHSDLGDLAELLKELLQLLFIETLGQMADIYDTLLVELTTLHSELVESARDLGWDDLGHLLSLSTSSCCYLLYHFKTSII